MSSRSAKLFHAKGKIVLSLIISFSNLKKNSLEAYEATNVLSIDPSFRLCQQFTAKCYMETFEFDITKHILGEVFNTATHQSDYSHLETKTEDVIEKPEFASTIGENFRHLPKTDLAEILYGGKHIL